MDDIIKHWNIYNELGQRVGEVYSVSGRNAARFAKDVYPTAQYVTSGIIIQKIIKAE